MITIEGINYINEKEASAKYGLSLAWFRNRRYSEPKMPYHKLNQYVYYNPHEVDAWFKENFKAL